MHIATLKIRNLRGIQEGFFFFRKHSMLVGGRNVGKSTITKALTLLFGWDRLVHELTEHNLYGSGPQPQDRIELVAAITGYPGGHHGLSW